MTDDGHSPDPALLARLAKLVGAYQTNGLDLGTIPGVPTDEWLSIKESELETHMGQAQPEASDKQESTVAPDPMLLARLAKLVAGYKRHGLVLGEVPGVPSEPWVQEKETVLQQYVSALQARQPKKTQESNNTTEPSESDVAGQTGGSADQFQSQTFGPGPVSPPKRKKKALRIVGALFGVLVLCFLYWAYIKPGPGEWDREELEDWISNTEFTRTNYDGTGNDDSIGQLEVDLDDSTDEVEILGVDFERWEGEGKVGSELECDVTAFQNEEIGIAMATSSCTGKDELDWSTDKTTIHPFQGCGRHGVGDVILELVLEPFVSRNSSDSPEEALKKEIEGLEKHRDRVKEALNEADEDQEGDCKTVFEHAEDVVKEMEETIKTMKETLKEM